MKSDNELNELKYLNERLNLKNQKLLNNIANQADIIAELEVENELLKLAMENKNQTIEAQG
ncbi:hypothetical protein QOK74_08550 [Staphylococcus saprophyticus]|uniref:hypothetical protein n=1 Tax=Staphylococcus saprophyticus TaxID=29385 RepID=UPI0024C35F25|nr:hypothetical protein [Staphylococcus saprophyticus]MDK1672922.1 hypothetical protein [Staphylococcus saprophyticus]